jgi:hypothetical protein
MDAIVFDQIPCQLSYPKIAKKMRVRAGSKQEDQLHVLVEEAQAIARPRAMYTIVTVDEKDEEGVVLDGVRMKSRVMRVNLDTVFRVFPYLVTCGQELYSWKQSQEDLILNYYADEINQMAMRTASRYLQDHLKETYQLGKTATMSPGSLEDWPVTAQRPLFQLLGDPQTAIGVELLDSMLMIPNQTISGIRFATESDFTSCELCPIENCPHRKAPYDETLFQEKYS